MLSPPPYLLSTPPSRVTVASHRRTKRQRHQQVIVILVVLQLQIMVNVIECQQQQQLLHHHHHLRGNTNCPFNTMCSCQWGTSTTGTNNEANTFILDGGGPYIHDIACLGIPLTKLPSKFSISYTRNLTRSFGLVLLFVCVG